MVNSEHNGPFNPDQFQPSSLLARVVLQKVMEQLKREEREAQAHVLMRQTLEKMRLPGAGGKDIVG